MNDNQKKEASPVRKASDQSTDIVAHSHNIVMPAVTGKEALIAWKAYEELKGEILDPKVDIQKIQGKDFKKKSYWRKLATFFNLSIETVSEKAEKLGSTFVWHYTVKVTAPNGRYVEGIGSCDTFEKATKNSDGRYVDSYGNPAKPNSIHNIRSTAYTRAYNRAVSDLVGGGEVSAEEIND